MTPGRLLLLAFLTVTLAALAAMRLWTMPLIRAGAGDLHMPDMLIEGYSADYLALYLDLLTAEARGLYLGPQRVLDTVMPMALTGTLAVAAWLLTVRWGRILAGALGLIPLFYFAFDMLENAQIAAILARGAATAEMAEAASRFTMSKAQALRFAFTAVLFLASARVIEAVLERRSGKEGA